MAKQVRADLAMLKRRQWMPSTFEQVGAHAWRQFYPGVISSVNCFVIVLRECRPLKSERPSSTASPIRRNPQSGVRDVLIYCRIIAAVRHVEISADQWPRISGSPIPNELHLHRPC
jgi:hypothetical protein